MKTSLFAFVAALGLFASSTGFAAPLYDHSNGYGRRTEDVRRMSPAERQRYEAAQRQYQRENERRLAQERAQYNRNQQLAQQRARIEAQRRAEQQKAAERARWEAQHRNDRHNDRGRDYGYNSGHR